MNQREGGGSGEEETKKKKKLNAEEERTALTKRHQSLHDHLHTFASFIAPVSACDDHAVCFISLILL